MEVFTCARKGHFDRNGKKASKGEAGAGIRKPAKQGARGSAGSSTEPRIEKRRRLDDLDAPQVFNKGEASFDNAEPVSKPKCGLFVEGTVRNTRCSFLVDSGSTDTSIVKCTARCQGSKGW